MGRVTFDGRVDISYVGDEQVSREGGQHDLAVPAGGWRNVNVELDTPIEAHLVLVPPGCAGPEAPCALTQPFEETAGEPSAWIVPRMQGGTWQVIVDGEANGQAFRSGQYTITLDYVQDK